LTYIFIAHGIPVVTHMSDRIAVMYLGKIVELTTKEKIYTQPQHPYTEGLINSVPTPDPFDRAKRNLPILEGDNPNPINIPEGCRFRTRCPYAQDICKVEEPELRDIGDNNKVACHFPISVSKEVPMTTKNLS